MRLRPRTLRGRLALFYAVVLATVLGAFALLTYLVVEAAEADEPPEIRALEPPDATGKRVLMALAVALPVALLVAVGGAAWVARRGLTPLDDAVRTAERIGTDSLDQRVPVREDAAEEIGRLTLALNGMLARLERSVATMRRFTADASHELRTPLATLLGELEVALRRPRTADELRATVETSLDELGRLSRLVEALLALARSDAGSLPLAAESCDLAQLVARTVDPYEAVAAARGVKLRLAAPAALPARVDPLWAGRAVANLVDNACKFTPEGGEIDVTVSEHDGRARIEVKNSGPALDPTEHARLFERFYRGERARAGSGSGLGLALAREIARAHGGELAALQPSSGVAFALDLPLAPPPTAT